jgi:branched-chain amino acid transport system permease protein
MTNDTETLPEAGGGSPGSEIDELLGGGGNDRRYEMPPPATLARLGAAAAGLLVLWFVADSLMTRGLPFGIIVLGTVFGSLYALLAIGLVLVYRANRVVNFAQAELGSVAAVMTIQFVLVWDMNYFVALLLGFGTAAAIGGFVNVAVIQRFRNAPRLILTVATIGIAQILNAMSIFAAIIIQGGVGGGQRRFSAPVDATFSIDPVIFNANHVLAIVTVPVVMVGLIAFLRYTSYGMAIRAAADNGDRASLLGIPVPRLSTIVWSLAGFLSAVAIILRVPIVGFASFQSVSGGGNSLLLRTLAAAVIGRMESIPRTVVAAICLGIFQEAASWQFANTDFVDAALVIVILAGLLIQRDFFSRAQEAGISTWKAIREVRPIPEELRRLPEIRYGFGAVKVLLLGAALAYPLIASPSQASAMVIIFIYAIVAVSLFVLTGWAGHISLGQFALAGFGGAATSVLYGRHGLDFLIALPIGMVVAALVALVIGLPALRIKGPFLAVTTLAFAVTAANFLLVERYFPWFIERRIERPVLWNRIPLDEGWQMYYFTLVGLLLTLAVVRSLRNSRTGRAIIAVRDNSTAAESVTMDVTRTKLVAFMISGAIAGFAGGLYVLDQQGLQTDAYGAEASIRLFSMVVIGGLGSLPGAVMGAFYIRGAEFMLPPAWSLLASGFGILFLLMVIPEGLGGIVYKVRDSILRKVAVRRGLVVPSLLADVRTEGGGAKSDEIEAEVALGSALSGLSAEPEREPPEGPLGGPSKATTKVGS